MDKKLLTLALISDGRLLLGMKKRGFGEGRFNGFGGKINEGETIEAAMVRECEEESGVTPAEYKKVAILEFSFLKDFPPLEVHVFFVTTYFGQPDESEEMRPQWFDYDKIPYDKMWPDDRFWLPPVLEGKSVVANFQFDEPSTSVYTSQILGHSLTVVEEDL